MIFKARATLILVAAILAVTAVAYLPGIRGPFLFDDWASLPVLGENGPIHDIGSFLRYVTSGTADPTGRPIALASFVLNARDWPAAPLPFKVTNLAIHLLNVLLLGQFLTLLGRRYELRHRLTHTAAWLAAAMWALHPFLVSTVLYVVQREAMLVSTFALVALIAWLTARNAFAKQGRYAAAWLYVGGGGATLLAIMCKANGVVIPLLAMVIDITLPAMPHPVAQRYTWHRRIALVVPSALLLAALAWLAISAFGEPPLLVRGWSIDQRLITEPAILFDYLARLWLLKPAAGTFFHDQLVPVNSLFDPWYAWIAPLVWIATLCAAIALRRRAPSVAVAILFFGAGQVLESTSVPLELYFEHRNYLPAALMFWPLSLAILTSRYRWLRLGLPAVLLSGLFLLTRSQAMLWGDELTQATVWADQQLGSPRAQANAAQAEFSRGLLRAARQRIDRASLRFPAEPQIAINLIDIHCATGGVSTSDLTFAARAFATAPRDPGALLTRWFQSRIEDLSRRPCTGLDDTALDSLVEAMARNERATSLPGRRQDIAHLRGTIALRSGDAAKAQGMFAQALAEEPTAKVALNEAALLGNAGYPARGLQHLELLETLPVEPGPSPSDGMAWIHAQILRRDRYWPREIEHLRDALTQQARDQDSAVPSHE
ncbi:tetratricopeptide repeat protein [Luteibacter sp. ME-Dv--P-043b]|uniref:tetratricopeptide repeat protein n=1 Tax=Luteibacter sp. ME-Dv--P-043b TaxID=3040291 RepID=UPI0025564DA8|nr:tetratricopeptide repeat protein [Luteibacter sp. ME-Dv--P-043b]